MNCCVYTVLLGGYENLNEQPAAARSSLPFICLTDDASLQSASWDCRLIEPLFPEDPIRSQRDLKIRSHLYMGDYDCSIYIDNSVVLKQPPERLLDLYEPENGFLIPYHSYRASVLDEFLEIARLGLDDSTRIFEQLNHYMLSVPEILAQPAFWSAILVRDHRSSKVRSMLEIWASHVMRYSRRDQLSINVALAAAGLTPTVLTVDNFGSDLHVWPVVNGRDRQRGNRNLNVSLMPVPARIREFEQRQGSLQADIARLNAEAEAARLAAESTRLAAEAEIARLYAKAEYRKPKNRLRRLGRKIVGLPARIARSMQSAPAVDLPPPPLMDRVRSQNGSWIYVDPSDGRGRALVESGGSFNPPTMAIWQRLLAEQAWTHIIDVGANYGEMLANGGLPAKAGLVAIEPNPAINAYLKRTLAEAGLTVRIVDAALSDREGEAALFIDKEWSGTSRLKQADNEGSVTVRTTTLTAVLRDAGAKPSSTRLLLKVDVEGHEASVLRGAISSLPLLEDFAALVEILHVPDADLAWISDNFRISLLEEGSNGTLVDVPAGELKKMLGSELYYNQDAVLRRRS